MNKNARQPTRTRLERVYKKPIGMIGFCGKINYDVAWWKLGEVVKLSPAGSGHERIEKEAPVEMGCYGLVA